MARTSGKKVTKKQQTVASETFVDYVPPKFVGEALGSEDISTPKRGRLPTNFSTRVEFPYISRVPSPFKNNGTTLDSSDPIKLCQKAYSCFPLLRNTIDVMTELTNSRVFLSGGSQKQRDLVGAWLDRIGFWQLKEQFFREFYLSGTVALYRFDAEYQQADIAKMTQVFGSISTRIVPVRYIILNPAELRVGANISFETPQYYKVLSHYELERIRNPKTEEDRQVLKSLGEEAVRDIKNGTTPLLKLDPERLSMVFYKKQPYQPMALPFAYPLLKDINTKMELKEIDLRIARQAERALLLITAGDEPAKGGINWKNIEALQELFSNESVTRTLIADYTVKGEWLIPDINKVLGAEKYEQIDKDISAGLNAILFNSDEKFASTSIKVQVFVERLKEARSAFLNNFLQPEIKRVCQAMNAKSYPEAQFEEINLRDDLQFSKLYIQMAQVGLLTANELFEAMDTGKLPLPEDSLESQKAYKKHRASGLYVPLVGGPKDPNATAGRPEGAKAPQSTKTVSPVGTTTKAFSTAKLKEVAIAAEELKSLTAKKLARKFKIKALDEKQAAVARLITESIMANEDISKWQESLAQYINAPKDIAPEIADEIDSICLAHDVDGFLASILRLSQVDEK